MMKRNCKYRGQGNSKGEDDSFQLGMAFFGSGLHEEVVNPN